MTSRFHIRAALIAYAETSETYERLVMADAPDAVTDAAAAKYLAAVKELDRIASEALAEKRREQQAMGLAVRVDSRELGDLIANDGEDPGRVEVMEGEAFR